MEPTNLNIIDVTPNKDGGVLKEIKRHGEGNVSPYLGDKVFVHYVGTLTDGSQFDSSRDRDEQFEFDLGKGNVIKAWDLGVATMKRGELAVFTCKPEYAYGEHGSPPKIGKNETLFFEVELFDWKGEDISAENDESIIRHQIRLGDGYQHPNEGATVKIHLVGRHDGRLFEERDVTFIVGEGNKENIVPGVDHALTKFKKGEHCILEIKSQHCYGSEGNETFEIPPNADLEYEIILNQFEKAKESWEMEPSEKLEQSHIVKAKGTVFFKEESYEKAITQYKKIISYLEGETKLKEDEKSERDTLLLAAYLNVSMCYLKLNNFKLTHEFCDKALEVDSQNTKALYRRAQSFDKRNDFDLAIKDYQTLLTIEPENKAAKNQLTLCRHKLKSFADEQKRRYGGMFAKFAAQDEKNRPPQANGDVKDEDKNDGKQDNEISSEDEVTVGEENSGE